MNNLFLFFLTERDRICGKQTCGYHGTKEKAQFGRPLRDGRTSVHRIRLNVSLPTIVNVDVSQRGKRWVYPLLCFFQHSLSCFLRKIVDVVLCHQDFDTVNKLFRRARFRREHKILLNEVDLQVQFVKDDPVFQVPVETISFFYEKNGAGFLLCRWFMLFLKGIHHFCEARSSRLLSGFHIHIIFNHCKALPRSIVG